MTTVGIMSMQRIYNYGSFLQAFALKRLIEGVVPNAQVEFLDYRPGTPMIQSSEARRGRLGRGLLKLKEYSQVDAGLLDKLRFFNHKRTYASRFFPLLGLTESPNYDYEVDIQVIGSDEVFNCVQSNSNVGYSRDLFGHATKARRLISYAASFGNTTYEKIQAHSIENDLRDDLARFDLISVRDRNSAAIVEQLSGRVPDINVDPVLAYDYLGLESGIPSQRLHEAPYVIVYGYSGRFNQSENDRIRAYARRIGAKVLCFGGVQSCCDRYVDCSPFELLAYFRDAEFIVTDTFHGTIFSIINDKPFLTLIRKSAGHGYGNEEKLGYLLEIFGLSARGHGTVTTDVLDQLIGDPIDYISVGHALSIERKKTRHYLTMALSAEELAR